VTVPARGDRPWLGSYGPGRPADLEPEFASALDMFRASAARAPQAAAIRYFDGVLTFGGLDEASDALAAGLLARGFRPGERVALYLQNVPQFVVALVATWKAGGIAVAVNPMNKHQELDLLLRDSGAAVLVCLEGLYEQVARDVVPGTDVRLVLTTSELEHQSRDDARLFAGVRRVDCAGALDLAAFVDEHRGRRLPPASPGPDDVAFLTYTSGTTGPPKGAMNTHGNVVTSSQNLREWCRLGPDDEILGVAPLFHITGLVAHVTLALLLGVPLVLFHRFEPAVAVDTIREHRPTFTIGAITVFIALMDAPDAEREALTSLTKIWSGGAPIPPSTVAAFSERFGRYIHPMYGLTETTSPSHGVPFGAEAPVDAASGALSIGVPVHGTVARVVGDDGDELPPGEVGEIVIRGPQVVPGYWNQPHETAHAIPDGALHTGDVGYMDEAGWFYVVDRKKDQINAGGYKVWPREVEDVLYEHAAVREAAVVGVPDAYRGETVNAFVSLRPDRHVAPDELVDFCRRRMAAYKYPRVVEVLDELPKTVTGKLLRRELRARATSQQRAQQSPSDHSR
jgi:long-chain acyl-CoA synthetase